MRNFEFIHIITTVPLKTECPFQTNLKLVIQASDPQGNGITRAYSKAAAFDDPSTPVATAVDIKAKYDAKCGTLSAGSLN